MEREPRQSALFKRPTGATAQDFQRHELFSGFTAIFEIAGCEPCQSIAALVQGIRPFLAASGSGFPKTAVTTTLFVPARRLTCCEYRNPARYLVNNAG